MNGRQIWLIRENGQIGLTRLKPCMYEHAPKIHGSDVERQLSEPSQFFHAKLHSYSADKCGCVCVFMGARHKYQVVQIDR